VLALLGDSVSDAVKSGAHGIVREISSGVQTYETDPSLYPVNQPIGKYEGKSQCTGEAVYVNDLPIVPGELCAAFVSSTVANCELDSVDPSDALVSANLVQNMASPA
jgi:xanthine dehydrogenase/oxidase